MKNTWQLYSETIFCASQWLPEQATGFIITAFNPRGELLRPPANLLRNNRLRQQLEDEGHCFRAITGWAPDFSHGEASWFVFADLATGLRLARQFEQNAIYWLEDGQLILWPCLLTQQQATPLGQFHDRLSCC